MRDGENTASLAARSQQGDREAYGLLVQRFQDMAVGYAFSILRDLGLAEDAAQEAFIDAYRRLAALREPAAFLAWLRRIVFKHCDRLRRRARIATSPLDEVGELASPGADPSQAAQRNEIKRKVLEAIAALPGAEREATTLFYIDGYSQDEVSQFLDVPVTTVKNRLRSARNRLRERMSDMVEKELKRSKPGKAFAKRLMRRIAGMRMHVGREQTGSTSDLLLIDSRQCSLPISLGRAEAAALAPWLDGKGSLEATDIHTACVRALERFGWGLGEVVLEELRNNGAFARVCLRKGKQAVEAKTRLSDALNFAARCGAPIYVDPAAAGAREMKQHKGKPAEAWATILKWRKRGQRIPRFEAVLRKLEQEPESEEARRHFPWALMTRKSRGVFGHDPGKLAILERWARQQRGGRLEGVASGLLGAAYLHCFRNEPAKAMAPLETAYRLRPDDLAVAFDLATACALAGKKDRALALLDGLKKTPEGTGALAQRLRREGLCPLVTLYGNFAPLWGDARFRRLFGEGRTTRADTFFIAQIHHAITGLWGVKLPKKKIVYPSLVKLVRGPQSRRPPVEAPAKRGKLTAVLREDERELPRLEALMEGGKLLTVLTASRSPASDKNPLLCLDLAGGLTASIRLTREERSLFDRGYLTALHPNHALLEHQAVLAALKAAGIEVEAAALVKQVRSRIEAVIVLTDGARRETVGLQPFAAIRLACAARRPLFLTEDLASRLHARMRVVTTLSR